MTRKMINFNKPYMTGKELHNISQAHYRGMLAGDGSFTKKCHEWLETNVGCRKALLTHSCTAALEMAALLIDTQPGDEIIMPSYTFVSTANAFVLRGGIPVFVDICPDTQNIDVSKIEGAVTPMTKAIVPVHYAGVGCEMDTILDIAKRHDLFVIEDAAQGAMATYKKKPLGSMGHLGALSFHETKNVISGEGGALLINDDQFKERGEIIREKGTNRSQFFRGQVDKYSWVDIGSSYLPGEIIAAFLSAQLEESGSITSRRLQIWGEYHEGFAVLEAQGYLRRPVIPDDCQHNAHMYYVLVESLDVRTALLKFLKDKDVLSVFHYIPLHTSPAGRRYGRFDQDLSVTDAISDRILRLPVYVEMEDAPQIVELVEEFFHSF